jgi:hypothetical protein
MHFTINYRGQNKESTYLCHSYIGNGSVFIIINKLIYLNYFYIGHIYAIDILGMVSVFIIINKSIYLNYFYIENEILEISYFNNKYYLETTKLSLY